LNNKSIKFQSKHQKRQIRPPNPGRRFFHCPVWTRWRI